MSREWLIFISLIEVIVIGILLCEYTQKESAYSHTEIMRFPPFLSGIQLPDNPSRCGAKTASITMKRESIMSGASRMSTEVDIARIMQIAYQRIAIHLIDR